MGDFDRVDNAPKANETKKIAVVLVLGVVLIGLVATQFMKHSGPQNAAGAPTVNTADLSAPALPEDLSPAQVAALIADLQKDPTTALLHPVGAKDPALAAAPRNPFGISKTWLAQLIIDKPAPTPTVTPRTPTDPPPTTPLRTPVGLRADDYKLTGILNGNTAVINGTVVKTGATIGRARVIGIHDKTVVLQPADFPDAPTVELNFQSSLNPN
jgi:hypothetical protein